MTVTAKQAFVASTVAAAAALGGCATRGGPLTSESSPYRDNVIAVTGGVATYAGVRAAGLAHAGSAGLLVAAALKLAGSFSPKDYCSTRSVQVGINHNRTSGQPVDGGVQTYTQTDCVQENVVYRPGDFIPVVRDGVNKPPSTPDQTFEVVEQRRSVDPLTGQAVAVPLVRDVTVGASTDRRYLLHVYNREARNDQTGETIKTSVVFMNEINPENRRYIPPSRQPALPQTPHSGYSDPGSSGYSDPMWYCRTPILDLFCSPSARR